VIVDGIRQGRIAVANTSKYIKATLASSFGNFYAVAIVSLFVDFLPMLPLQILLLNLLSDFPMIAIATDTVDKHETSRPNMQSVRDILLVATILGIVSTFFDFVFFGLFHSYEPSVLQTNWFIGSTLTELVFLFSIRTRLPILRATRPPLFIVLLTTSAFVSTIVVPYVPVLARIFHFTPPTFAHMILILGVVVVYFFSTESVKLLYYRFIARDAGIARIRGRRRRAS
jgi:Mg2+-importing ATPase